MQSKVNGVRGNKTVYYEKMIINEQYNVGGIPSLVGVGAEKRPYLLFLSPANLRSKNVSDS